MQSQNQLFCHGEKQLCTVVSSFSPRHNQLIHVGRTISQRVTICQERVFFLGFPGNISEVNGLNVSNVLVGSERGTLFFWKARFVKLKRFEARLSSLRFWTVITESKFKLIQKSHVTILSILLKHIRTLQTRFLIMWDRPQTKCTIKPISGVHTEITMGSYGLNKEEICFET